MMNNEKMYTNVMEKLEFEPSLDESNITISIKGNNDIVVLDGTVSSFTDKLAAEKAIKSLANVRTVVNEIEVDYLFNIAKLMLK